MRIEIVDYGALGIKSSDEVKDYRLVSESEEESKILKEIGELVILEISSYGLGTKNVDMTFRGARTTTYDKLRFLYYILSALEGLKIPDSVVKHNIIPLKKYIEGKLDEY